MILADNMNLDGLVIFFLLIIFGPPLLLVLIGFAIKSNSAKGAKVLFIMAVTYLLIAGGICGTLMMG
ncbi:hypothetical protein [Fulvivirga ligni]|uniref:hypothetical protein n=1 Tax=Fulvivirga ligni TaxID=2904246 RepID=UPI001F326BFC|nr:hypothetical protein [Fulvivirga ligni]UII22302.1 hypothetical protein LVD16_03540 [Fulvivirga ligni]